jgi:hypothetical protein
MIRNIRRLALTLLFAALLIPVGSAVALAHGSTTVGDYTLIIGFHNEPAYRGEPNALDLFVANTKTKEKIDGLAASLKVEISLGAAKKELKLRPQAGRAGAYTAYVLPSEKGLYTWHVFGSIKGTPVDVSMTSSPTTFSAVVDASEVAFPSVEATTAELQAQAAAAANSAHTALMVGIAGSLLGVIGIAVGVFGLSTRRGYAARERGQAQRAA